MTPAWSTRRAEAGIRRNRFTVNHLSRKPGFSRCQRFLLRDEAIVVHPDVPGAYCPPIDGEQKEVPQHCPRAAAMSGNDCRVDERRALAEGDPLSAAKTVHEVFMHVARDTGDDCPTFSS